MKQKLVQKQEQRLQFSQKMQESMYILQIPILELRNLIANELETNPTLEETAPLETTPLITHRKVEDNDIRRDMRISRPITLHEHLLKQLKIHAVSEEDVLIGEEIIGNIDDDGYLKSSYEEIAHRVNKDVGKVFGIVGIVQSFDPVGVCARDLRESLLIQLLVKGKKDSLSWKIVENHLTECGKKQYYKIAKTLNVSNDEVQSAVSEIARLEPKPGRRYSGGSDNHYIIPDIYIKNVDGEYHVINNRYDVPNIKINTMYQSILKDRDSDKETQVYIREKLKGANFLIKCIEQRRETMQKITEFLIKEQTEFIEKGRSYLKPLTFKEMADAIGRHESTISRAIANKYIDTPSGTFELREFFGGKINRPNGKSEKPAREDNNHSDTSVKEEIKHIIDNENKKKPLSDLKIGKILKEKGIDISRRTVAKYREEMKILQSYLRKS